MRAAVPSEEVAPLVNVPAASLREVAGPESAALDNEASALPTDDRFNILESLGTQPEISVGEDGYTPVSNPPPTVVETPTAADRLNILNRLSAEAEIVPE